VRQAKLKVKLLAFTKNPQKVVAAAIRQCYSAVGASDLIQKIPLEKQKELIKMVLGSGHTSTLEHASFTFAIEGISRACSHQLVRHRLASYSQQSQRYVDLTKKGIKFVVPTSISQDKEKFALFKKQMENSEKIYAQLLEKGANPEDARFVLPNACETKIVVTMNARELLHFFELRLCQRAQWEIRAMAEKMLELVKKVAPEIFNFAGPTCETQKICWEGERTCGKWKKIKGAVLKSRIK